jgi:hypothetical protein
VERRRPGGAEEDHEEAPREEVASRRRLERRRKEEKEPGDSKFQQPDGVSARNRNFTKFLPPFVLKWRSICRGQVSR